MITSFINLLYHILKKTINVKYFITGDCQALSGAKIIDFIGESGSTLKQASDQFERAKAKATSVASSMYVT